MKRFAFTTILTLAALMALAQEDVQPTGTLAGLIKPEQKVGAQIPLDTRFKDEEGREISFGSLVGKRPLVILPMFFNCAGVCRVEMENLFKMVNKDKKLTAGKDYDVVFFGIHPKETPELAAAKERVFVENYKRPTGEEGFHALTGEMGMIRQVTDAIGFNFTYDEATGRINHPAEIVFVDKKGKVSGYIFGADFPTEVFRKNVAAAESGKPGVEPELVFLGCIMIDPVTGQRTLVIQNVMKVAGSATAIFVALWVFSMSRKYRVSPVPGGPRGGHSHP